MVFLVRECPVALRAASHTGDCHLFSRFFIPYVEQPNDQNKKTSHTFELRLVRLSPLQPQRQATTYHEITMSECFDVVQGVFSP